MPHPHFGKSSGFFKAFADLASLAPPSVCLCLGESRTKALFFPSASLFPSLRRSPSGQPIHPPEVLQSTLAKPGAPPYNRTYHSPCWPFGQTRTPPCFFSNFHVKGKLFRKGIPSNADPTHPGPRSNPPLVRRLSFSPTTQRILPRSWLSALKLHRRAGTVVLPPLPPPLKVLIPLPCAGF